MVVRDAVGGRAARKRAARVAPLPARRPAARLPAEPLTLLQLLRRRLRQPVARRRLAAVGTVKTETTLEFGDARGLVGNHGIAFRAGRRQVGNLTGQCLKIVDRLWHGRPACPVCCSSPAASAVLVSKPMKHAAPIVKQDHDECAASPERT